MTVCSLKTPILNIKYGTLDIYKWKVLSSRTFKQEIF